MSFKHDCFEVSFKLVHSTPQCEQAITKYTYQIFLNTQNLLCITKLVYFHSNQIYSSVDVIIQIKATIQSDLTMDVALASLSKNITMSILTSLSVQSNSLSQDAGKVSSKNDLKIVVDLKRPETQDPYPPVQQELPRDPKREYNKSFHHLLDFFKYI